VSEELRARLRALPSFPTELPAFDPEAVPDTPEPLFLDWLDEAGAAGVLAPHAAALATTDPGGPSARVLILKDLDESGWQIATPADSRPGAAMAASAEAALTFFWPQLGRQVRVEGAVTRASDAEAAADFLARPAGARATALVGRPPHPLSGDEEYVTVRARASERIDADPELVPANWALWRVQATTVEFWQASHDRAHRRLQYVRSGERWERRRLWP